MKRGRGKPTGFRGQWLEMVEKAGSVTELALLCGKSMRTVQRWAMLDYPVSEDAEYVVNKVAKLLGVRSPFGGVHYPSTEIRIRATGTGDDDGN